MERALKQATQLSLKMINGILFFMLGFGLSYQNNLVGDSVSFLLRCYDFILGYGDYYLQDLYQTSYLLLSGLSFSIDLYDELLFQLISVFVVLFAGLLLLSVISGSLKRLLE